ncbi:MAG: efflux RND transporter periplasmic adaptor subunit [Planctomycetaceae bacterium]|nr:efflux RND transporter periplasmic adaptor subunit [Planctomycetaceae bacterium]
MTRWLGSLLGAALGAILVAGLAYTGRLPGVSRTGSGDLPARLPTGTVATSPPQAQVVALAKLQPAAGVLELGGVPGDKVERIYVKAGQAVKRDDPLLSFDSRTLRQLEVDAARTQLAEAEARLKAEQDYADAMVAEAQLLVDQLQLDEMELAAQETRAKSLKEQAEASARNYERVGKLSKELISGQQLDQAKLARDQAANEYAAAQEQIAKAKQGIALKRREAELKRSQAAAGRAKVDATVPLESLRKQLAAAEERLKSATLKSPIDGVVLELPAVEGGSVAQVPLIRLADVRSMAAVAEVYETQVAGIREGQPVELSADVLPRKLQGTVERVGQTVGKNRMLSLDPTQPSDAHVVEVRIKLDDASAQIAARFVGLQTTAAIRTGP